jgi:uncharacterized damage-inducible protein DinB
MNYIVELCAYNAWANARILPLVGGLTNEQLTTRVEGIFGCISDTANHLVAVERVYCQMLAGDAPVEPKELPAVELAASAAVLDAALVELAKGADAASLDVTFLVPWFKRSFTRGDGMLQLVTHSTEHRADLCSALTRMGVSTPPIDYVQYVIDAGR